MPPSTPRPTASRSSSPVKTIRSKVVVPFPSSSSVAEPIKTYLRLRPAQPSKSSSDPYITVHNDTDIIMKPPPDLPRAPQHYSFAKVFQPTAADDAGPSQARFFQETCVPMVEALLNNDQSGLYCTYGTTCSGKSYTVHGGNSKVEAGVLPRTLDTIFNSLDGSFSPRRIRPKGLNGVEELIDENQEDKDQFDPLTLPPLRQKLMESGHPTLGASSGTGTGNLTEYEHDPTTIKVDKNYRYSVWISYCEVYNEKIYDLLDVASNDSSPPRSKHWSLGGHRMGSTMGSEAACNGGPVLTRHALSLQSDADTAGDPEGQCKYAAGLSEHQVHSAAEARALIRRGEQNRAVFGTMANRVSSRSHGVFTVRIIRHHAGEQGADALYTTSRMSIVDLAGSERMANTQLTDSARMKEAGNINKSLMNLGHCIEKIRSNQSRMQAMLASGGAENAKPEMVPYNSSKLTSLLKTYFVGEGTAVMIITANPFDGGFYENAQVMKFSATIRDVTRQRQSSAVARSPTKVSLAPQGGRKNGASISSPRSTASRVRPSASTSSSSLAPRTTQAPMPESTETDITIIEEGDDEPQDPLVDMLIAKCEELQQRLYLAEQRAATVEATVRSEMADEMESALQAMSRMYEQRLQQELHLNEEITNKKLDLLNDLFHENRSNPQESFESSIASFRSLDDQSDGSKATIMDEHQESSNAEPSHGPSDAARIASTSGPAGLTDAFNRTRIASKEAPALPTTPGRRVMPAAIPEVRTPGDPFRSIAVAPRASAPRASFGGSPTRPTYNPPGTALRSSMASLTFGPQVAENQAQLAPTAAADQAQTAPAAENQAQLAAASAQATDATTVENEAPSAKTDEPVPALFDGQGPRLPSTSQPVPAQDESSKEDLDSNDNTEQNGGERNGTEGGADDDVSEESSSEKSSDSSESEEDDSFDPTGEPSSREVTPPPSSPIKRRSARTSTAAKTEAATSRFKARKSSISNGSEPSTSKKSIAPQRGKPSMTRGSSLLQSTRPSAAAVQAAASFAPAARPKRSVLSRSSRSDASSSSRSSGETVKRTRQASTSRPRVNSIGVLSDAGAELANRRPTSSAPINVDLSSDISLLKPPPDSPKKKRRALRTSSAVDEGGMAIHLDDA